MTRIAIPTGAWMKYRKQGRWVYSTKGPTIIWTSKPPPKGTTLYVVAWFNGQGTFMASRTEVQS